MIRFLINACLLVCLFTDSRAQENGHKMTTIVFENASLGYPIAVQATNNQTTGLLYPKSLAIKTENGDQKHYQKPLRMPVTYVRNKKEAKALVFLQAFDPASGVVIAQKPYEISYDPLSLHKTMTLNWTTDEKPTIKSISVDYSPNTGFVLVSPHLKNLHIVALKEDEIPFKITKEQ